MKFATILLVMFGLGGAAVAQKSVAERYLFSALNAERVQRGLPTLRWDDTLYRAARTHCQEMASRQSISHQYPGEPELTQRGKLAGSKFSTIAENVAMAPTSVRIHAAWMNSPGHRENILDAQVDSVGISVLERNGQLYAVQDFARTVVAMTFDEQEAAVGGLVSHVIPISLVNTEEARKTCLMSTGFAGERTPYFVMRFTASDLTRLPEQLKSKLATGKFHEVAVGACEGKSAGDFTAFHLAVMLYP